MTKSSSNAKGIEATLQARTNGSASAGGPAALVGAQLGNRATAAMFEEAIGPPSDRFEQEADRAAATIAHGGVVTEGLGFMSAGNNIQRKCSQCEEEEEEKIRRAPKGDAAAVVEAPAEAETPAAESEQQVASASADPGQEAVAPADAEPSAEANDAPALVVEDDQEAAPGQMRKGEFMTALRTAVCASADEAMVASGKDTQGCPWIDYWFGYYEGQDAAHLERAMRRYAPETAGAATATDSISMLTARVRRSVDVWAKTGEVTGVPDEAAAGAGSGGGVLDSFGGMFFKARPGGPQRANPVSVRNQLGSGQPLPGAVRTRMETAFGANFGAVRLHADATGAKLSDQLNARAFAIGSHVAFGSGEFSPGTIAGDALIAHELAHVVQQGGAESMPASSESTKSLEGDADQSAIAAVTSLWALGKGATRGVARNVMPALRSGLQLSRCKKGPTGKAKLKSGPTYTPGGTIAATKSGGQKSAAFDLSAEFENDSAHDINPACGEVRQYIQWTSDADIPNNAGFRPKIAFSANTWYEDRDTAGKRYGHRSGTYSECASINHYVDTRGSEDCDKGEVFKGHDAPIDGSGAKTGKWNFELRAVDACDGDKEIGTPATVTVDWK